jgi:hypothetical protein
MGYPKEVHRKCKIHRRTWDCIDHETFSEETDAHCPWCAVDRLNSLICAWAKYHKHSHQDWKAVPEHKALFDIAEMENTKCEE